MGQIAITFKVMPEGPDTDIDAIQDAARNLDEDVRDIGTEEVAFGLEAVKVAVVVNDEAGASDRVQNALQEIDGVESVDIAFTDKL